MATAIAIHTIHLTGFHGRMVVRPGEQFEAADEAVLALVARGAAKLVPALPSANETANETEAKPRRRRRRKASEAVEEPATETTDAADDESAPAADDLV